MRYLEAAEALILNLRWLHLHTVGFKRAATNMSDATAIAGVLPGVSQLGEALRLALGNFDQIPVGPDIIVIYYSIYQELVGISGAWPAAADAYERTGEALRQRFKASGDPSNTNKDTVRIGNELIQKVINIDYAGFLLIMVAEGLRRVTGNIHQITAALDFK